MINDIKNIYEHWGNLKTKQYKFEAIPGAWRNLGGRMSKKKEWIRPSILKLYSR
jgi:hypothetical protein